MPGSWKQGFQVDRRVFTLCFPLVFASNRQSGYLVIIISVVFPFAVDQQILLFINQVLAVVFSHFVVRDQLDCVGGAGLLAISTINASGKIYAEERGIASPVLVFCGLQGNAIDRAGSSAKVAGHTSFA